jgi:hypothetical protein
MDLINTVTHDYSFAVFTEMDPMGVLAEEVTISFNVEGLSVMSAGLPSRAVGPYSWADVCEVTAEKGPAEDDMELFFFTTTDGCFCFETEDAQIMKRARADCVLTSLGWTEFATDDGTPYFHHAKSDETTWEMPIELDDSAKAAAALVKQQQGEKKVAGREAAEKEEKEEAKENAKREIATVLAEAKEAREEAALLKEQVLLMQEETKAQASDPLQTTWEVPIELDDSASLQAVLKEPKPALEQLHDMLKISPVMTYKDKSSLPHMVEVVEVVSAYGQDIFRLKIVIQAADPSGRRFESKFNSRDILNQEMGQEKCLTQVMELIQVGLEQGDRREFQFPPNFSAEEKKQKLDALFSKLIKKARSGVYKAPSIAAVLAFFSEGCTSLAANLIGVSGQQQNTNELLMNVMDERLKIEKDRRGFMRKLQAVRKEISKAMASSNDFDTDKQRIGKEVYRTIEPLRELRKFRKRTVELLNRVVLENHALSLLETQLLQLSGDTGVLSARLKHQKRQKNGITYCHICSEWYVFRFISNGTHTHFLAGIQMAKACNSCSLVATFFTRDAPARGFWMRPE